MDEQALLIVGHFTRAEDAAQLHNATLEHYGGQPNTRKLAETCVQVQVQWMKNVNQLTFVSLAWGHSV